MGLEDAAVVGVETVLLNLHVAQLGVDGSVEALVVHVLDFVAQAIVEGGEILACLDHGVLEVTAGPDVAGHLERDAAILATDGGTVGVLRAAGVGIGVQVDDVAYLAVGPATGAADERCLAEAGRCQGIDLGVDQRGHAVGVELSPSLVEHHPVHDAGRVLDGRDDAGDLGLKIGFGKVLMALRQVGTGQVLPHEHAQAVGPVVPACRLNLDVLAHHVAAQVLHRLDVEVESLVAGGHIQAIGPPALVQRAHLEDLLVVQVDARQVVGILVHLNLAHAAVAVHLVGDCAILLGRDAQVIEVGVVGRPSMDRR